MQTAHDRYRKMAAGLFLSIQMQPRIHIHFLSVSSLIIHHQQAQSTTQPAAATTRLCVDLRPELQPTASFVSTFQENT